MKSARLVVNGARYLSCAVVAVVLFTAGATEAHAFRSPEASVTYVPVTAAIDEITVDFEVPGPRVDAPGSLVLVVPEEMRPGQLRSIDIRVVSDDVRPPAVETGSDRVVLSFANPVPPGSRLRVEISGLATPAEPGFYPVALLWGIQGSELAAGGFEVVVPSPSPLQSFVRAVEQVPFVRQFMSPTIIWDALPFLWKGFQVAVFILLVSYLLGMPFGLALAFMKMSRSVLLRWPATVYIDVIRGTPVLVQLLLVYFGLAFIPGWGALMQALGPLAAWEWHNVEANQFYRAFVVLSLNSAAYMAEIFRAGIQSIHKGQLEAARSLGMSWPASMAYVIIPQTVRRILPTMMSEFILLFKDTSILFAVGIFEIAMQARTISAATFNMSPLIAAAGFYLLLTIPLGRLVANLEDRLAVAETGRPRENRKPGRLLGGGRGRFARGTHVDAARERMRGTGG